MNTPEVHIFQFILLLAVPATLRAQPGSAPADQGNLSLSKALASGTDLWGDAAIARPEGPTYEFFRDLLPPLRYVNAAFRHYPIVLSAPGALIKPRLISNGSGINLRAKLSSWHEVGTPVTFKVGRQPEPFGADLNRLEGPHYLEGHLPVVQMTYRSGDETYEQEVFAPVDDLLAADGVLFVRFTCPDGGTITAHLDQTGVTTSQPDAGVGVVITHSPNWTWNTRQDSMSAELTKGKSAFLCVLTRPRTPANSPHIDADIYQQHRDACIHFWRDRLAAGMQIEVPEPIVNNAWRSLVIGTLMLTRGDRMEYSAGNAYEEMYESECGDAARALMLYGQPIRDLMKPLMQFTRQPYLKFHNAGFKLQLLAHYYWIMRDKSVVESFRKEWREAADLIIFNRKPPHGLLPQENYCGDIFTKVNALTTNSLCWRGLCDLAAVLRDMHDETQANDIQKAADEFRKAILNAVGKSSIGSKGDDAPFIPIALLGDERPPKPITGSKIGSYWNLVIPYVLDSGLSAPLEGSIMRYIQRFGGLCMGMIRFDQHSGLFANEKGIDDCYTLRYMLAQLRHDQPRRTLVTFYGKLAQGMTRDTFIGAEGTGLEPLDAHGRPMYLPPNCTSNAFFLWTLRYMLAQDWDLDDDGKPETLRLLYATPGARLENGKQIAVKNLPTTFGPLSLTVVSHLKEGHIRVHVELPPLRPKLMQLRLRLPAGWGVSYDQATHGSLSDHPDPVLDLTTEQSPYDHIVSIKRSR